MRITNNILAAQQLSAVQTNAAAFQRAQLVAISGKRVNVASDDPTAALGVMQSGSSLRALENYRTSVSRASSRISQEDSVLQQLNDLMIRVKEIGLSQTGDTASAQTRAAASAEVNQIFSQIVELGNTKFGNEYLFGGDQSLTRPFTVAGSGATVDFTTTNPAGQRAIAVDDGTSIAPTHDGKQIFLDTGVLAAVRDVARALDPSLAGVPANLANAMTQLDTAYNSVQGLIGETGALANRLTIVDENLAALKTNITTFRSDLQDVDIETALTELTNRQLAYQAALMATSKVAGMSLADYLR